jgi:hypothetical protein
MTAFARYLQAQGHPTGDQFNSLTQVERDATVNDPTFRCRLFLKAITTSPYLPLDPNETIKVVISVDLYSISDTSHPGQLCNKL